jgi:Sec-independent protein secretion pathway component TatC
MFYLLEILFRSQYILFSLSTTVLLCYLNKELLLFLLTFNILSSNYDIDLPNCGIDYFIYTHPLELLITYFIVILYFSLIFSLNALLWSISDFFRSSMNNSDFFTFRRGSVSFVFSVSFLNVIFVLFIFPSFWSCFQSFNDSLSRDITLNFFLELKIKDYFFFLKDIVLIINLSFFLIVTLQLLTKYLNLSSLLTWKKGLMLTNFILSTFLLSSDVLTQVIEIALLTAFFEFTIFTRVLILKFKDHFIFSFGSLIGFKVV